MPRSKVFISYSHDDRRWLAKLDPFMKTLGRDCAIDTWDDTKIKPGSRWKDEIEQALESTKVAVLLVSQTFLASDFIRDDELAAFLKASVGDGLTILWVAVSRSTWRMTPLSSFQAANDPEKPLNALPVHKLQGVLVEITEKIRSALTAEPVARSTSKSSASSPGDPTILSSTTSERLLFREELIRELPWRKVSEQTTKSLYIWAWSGVAAFNERTRNTFVSLLAAKKKVNFMIMDPRVARRVSAIMNMHPVCSWTARGVREDMTEARRNLVKFRSQLRNTEKKFLDLRETNWFMAWSGLAIDPDGDAGVLQIESYLYEYARSVKQGNHLDFRPNLLLTKDSHFFQPYWYSVQRMWNAAKRF